MILSAGDLGIRIDLGMDKPGAILQRKEQRRLSGLPGRGEPVFNPFDGVKLIYRQTDCSLKDAARPLSPWEQQSAKLMALRSRCGVESSNGDCFFVRFHGNLTEKSEKLTEKTASVLVSFMKKGFCSSYTPSDLVLGQVPEPFCLFLS